jgi:hypothetical protein
MSRLDRFLLSKEWGLHWPNCLQIALNRGLSNHCPIVSIRGAKDSYESIR